MEWSLKKFHELTLDELYAILKLRSNVFIVEQNCVYNDLDGKDELAWHLMGTENKNLIAYTRILPSGIVYPEPAIGRVVISPSKRKTGLGREIMKRSIDQCARLFGDTPVTLSAQAYLKKFYESFGFIAHGDEYFDDGILHIEMTRKAPRKKTA